MKLVTRISLVIWAMAAAAPFARTAELQWTHLTSRKGDLPVPGPSQQQTACLVLDADKDGTNDFVLGFRQTAPALVWYRHVAQGWDRVVIETNFLTLEAGGAVCDIDGDGDLDVIFGGDWESDEVWWWENPFPKFDPNVSWTRHTIKQGGVTQHHDQAVGDFRGTGKPQLAFWNQNARRIYLADIPSRPREAESWPMNMIHYAPGKATKTAKALPVEGMSACDIDGDGKVDLLACNSWFKHQGGAEFEAIRIASLGGLIFAGQLVEGGLAEVVISPGDGVGPLRWYECKGDPQDTNAWVGHNLLDRDVIHGHSLQLADIDGDGHLDIFCAEMAKWSERKTEPDNPNAKAWIFFGDGRGKFRTTEFATGMGFHEARVADLNGDGRPDILNKPYNWDAPRVDIWLNGGVKAAKPSPK